MNSITLALTFQRLERGQCARRVEPGVVGDALMLDLLAGMPAPQVGGFAVGAVKVARIGEQLMGEDRGEMLERHGRREADDRRLGLGDREPLLDPRLQLRQVVAGVGGAAVEGEMLAAVDHFLGGERLDFLGQLRVGAVAERAHAFDEEGLAAREGRRQRVVNSGRFDPSAVPQPLRRRVAAEAPVARGDGQVGRGRYIGRRHMLEVR